MIVRQIKCNEFTDALTARGFSIPGAQALYDYLNECSGYDDCEPYMFDAAKTAGEFKEQTPAQVCENAWHLLDSVDRERVRDGEAEDVASEFLEYPDGIVIVVENGNYIIGE